MSQLVASIEKQKQAVAHLMESHGPGSCLEIQGGSRNQRPASQTEEGEKLLRATVLYTSASCTKQYVVLLLPSVKCIL